MLPPPTVVVTAAPPLDNTFAWTLAIAPALGIVLDIGFCSSVTEVGIK